MYQVPHMLPRAARLPARSYHHKRRFLDRAIAAQVAAGQSDRAIGRMLDISYMTVARWRGANGRSARALYPASWRALRKLWLTELLALELSTEAIATEVGSTPASIDKIILQYGLRPRRAPCATKPATLARRARIADLAALGLRGHEIALAVGCAYSTVSRHLATHAATRDRRT